MTKGQRQLILLCLMTTALVAAEPPMSGLAADYRNITVSGGIIISGEYSTDDGINWSTVSGTSVLAAGDSVQGNLNVPGNYIMPNVMVTENVVVTDGTVTVNGSIGGNVEVTNTGSNAYGVTDENGSVNAAITGQVTATSDQQVVGVNVSSSTPLTITITGGVEAESTAASALSGAVDATGVQVQSSGELLLTSGAISARSTEGSVVGVMNAGTLEINASGGDITAESINNSAGGVFNSGQATISGVKDVTVSAGQIAFGISNLAGELTLNMNGDIDVSSSHGAVTAVQNANKLEINMDGGDIKAVSDALTAIAITNTGSDATIDAVKNITAKGKNEAIGITNAANAVLKITEMTGDITAEAQDNTAIGVTNAGDLTVTTVGGVAAESINGEAIGVSNSGNIDITVGDDSTIAATSTNAAATAVTNAGEATIKGGSILADGLSTVHAVYNSETLDITLTGGITAESSAGTAIGVSNSGNIDITAGDDSTIAATSTNSGATAVTNAGEATIKGGSILADGLGDAHAVYNSGELDLTLTGGITAESTSGWAYGVTNTQKLTLTMDGEDITAISTAGAATAITNTGSAATLEKVGSITATAAQDANGIVNSSGGVVSLAMTDSIQAESSAAAAIAVNSAFGTINISGYSAITAEGNTAATAISAMGSGTVNLNNTNAAQSEITIDSDRDTDSIIQVGDDSTVNFNNAKVYNKGDGEAAAIAASGSNGDGMVNASAGHITGNVVQSAAAGTLTVNLQDASTLVGAAQVTAGSAATIDIVVAGAGSSGGNTTANSSTWLVTDSSATNGVLTSTGIIQFDTTVLTPMSVTVGSLKGAGGLYYMSTIDNITAAEAGSDAGGLINLTDDYTPSTYQAVLGQPFIIVKANDDGTTDTDFSFTSSQGTENLYKLGAWKYNFAKLYNSATDSWEWTLLNGGTTDLITGAYSSLITPDVWYLETSGLYNRIGEYDNQRPNEAVWAYTYYNKTRYNMGAGLVGAADVQLANNTETKFKGLVAGMDRIMKQDDAGVLFGGIMLGYGEGDIGMNFGNTDFSSFHAGVYSVYRSTKGWYLAGVAKYNRYDTDLDIYDSGVRHQNSYGQNGWGLSFLTGQKFQGESGIFWEPQLEVGWHKRNTAGYELDGLPLVAESLSSVRGRMGVKFGKQFSYDNGKKLEVFGTVSVVHESQGTADLRVYTDGTRSAFDTLRVDYSGTWGQYKLGFDYKVKNTFGTRAAFTYEKGSKRETPLGVEVALNWYY